MGEFSDDLKQPGASDMLKQLKEIFLKSGGEADFSIATLAGLSEDEIKAAYATACQKLNVGDIDEATKLFSLLCLMAYKESKHWRGLGLCFHRKKQWPLAEFLYFRATQLDPNDVCSIAFRAEVLMWMNRRMAAQVEAQRAIDIQKTNPKREYQAYVKRAEAVLSQLANDNTAGSFDSPS